MTGRENTRPPSLNGVQDMLWGGGGRETEADLKVQLNSSHPRIYEFDTKKKKFYPLY
jgi:hypothetical protein